MIKIHQPYVKRKAHMTFAFASIGVLLLGNLAIINSPSETSTVYAAGDSRTIHDISDMQEMTQQICSNTNTDDVAELKDSRDTNTYAVYKATDGNCWMGENLRLDGDTPLKTTDSDVKSDWTLPASSDNSWSTNNDTAQMRNGNPDMAISSQYPGDGKQWRSGFGNYYSWAAATAGTGNTSVIDADAPSSICPLGWRLPAYSGDCSFSNLTSTKSAWQSGLTINGIANMAGYYFGSTINLAKGANFWPAAGRFYTDGLRYPGTDGRYWSRRAVPNNGNAYGLGFYSRFANPQDDSARFNGYSVRCLAPGGLPKIEKPTWSESKDGNITVTMPSIISIDATSGISKTADNNTIAEGAVTATISSNTEHAITIHSTQPLLKDPKVTTAEISPVSSTNPVQPGHNAWGFWNGTGDSNNKSYTLPITTTPQNVYNSKETITNPEGNPATKHTYYVGISISPSLPSGTYATNVIITASAK